MSDVYELTVTVDLRDELPEQQPAELRRHLGLGPQPGESMTTVRSVAPTIRSQAG